MRYSGYQNILSKVRYDYDSFDKDLSIIKVVVILPHRGTFTFC